MLVTNARSQRRSVQLSTIVLGANGGAGDQRDENIRVNGKCLQRAPCLAGTTLGFDRYPLLVTTRAWRDGNRRDDVARVSVSGLKALTVYQNSTMLILLTRGIDPQHSLEKPALLLSVE